MARMLMIFRETDETGTIKLILHGRFTSEYVPEVESSFPPNGCATEVAVDLTNVTFVDRPAMEFLRAIRSRNIRVKHLPSYVARWIRQEAGNDLNDENSDTLEIVTTRHTMVSRESR